jgi:hypothetical protein
MRTSFSVEHEACGQDCDSRDFRHCARDSIGASKMSGGIVRSGRIDSTENISVAVLIVWLMDSASSQVQLVDGVNAFSTGEGRRIGDTLGSTRKVTKGAQYDSGLDFHSGCDGSTCRRVCRGGRRSLQRLVVQQF